MYELRRSQAGSTGRKTVEAIKDWLPKKAEQLSRTAQTEEYAMQAVAEDEIDAALQPHMAPPADRKKEGKLPLLENLAKQLGCWYLSDLNLPENLWAVQRALRKVIPQAYSLWEWNDAVCYITGQKIAFERQADAANYLLRYSGTKRFCRGADREGNTP